MTIDPRSASTVERLYALEGGLATAPDKSEYSPGHEAKRPVALSCNCYLIRRAGEWVLWDSGIEDKLFEKSGGEVVAHNIRGIVSRPLVQQLHKLGLTTQDVRRVVLSHGHFDHVGNCALFPHATFYLQEVEHRAMFGPDYGKYGYVRRLYHVLRDAEVKLLPGDSDLFGDGSLRIFFTPGHTPGHCSMLVNLTNTGPVMLTADVAHYQFNLKNRLVPNMNSDAEQSRASMERLERLVEQYGATLWLNHDIEQNATIPHSPTFFD